RSSGSKHIRLRVRMITDSSGANTIMIFVSSITGRSLMTSTQAQRLLPLAGKPVGQLLVHEIYRSIQGESTFAGLPCVFVRLSVCDGRCVWCDTPHAFKEGKLRPMQEVVERVLDYHTPLVEITGGEPLLQAEVFPLMTLLADAGLTVL